MFSIVGPDCISDAQFHTQVILISLCVMQFHMHTQTFGVYMTKCFYFFKVKKYLWLCACLLMLVTLLFIQSVQQKSED